ncbi:MAG: hypothetical protein HUU34_06870 [Saprospiraceae bacterium]|jgi:hypothetical protein|nr:hypothetical protein [Saprospiraceae bacterium]
MLYKNLRIAVGIITALSLLLSISAVHNYRQYQELERLRSTHLLIPPPAPPAPPHISSIDVFHPADLEAVRREIEWEKSRLKAEINQELERMRAELAF